MFGKHFLGSVPTYLAAVPTLLAVIASSACSDSRPAERALDDGVRTTEGVRGSTAQERYAPMLALRADHPNLRVIEMLGGIPATNHVEIPAYPGSGVLEMSTYGSQGITGRMSVGGEDYETLPYITLLTDDRLDAVAAFYRQALTEHRHHVGPSGTAYFISKELPEFEEMTWPMAVQFAPAVMLSPIAVDDPTRLEAPAAHTKITVFFRPDRS